MQKGGALETDVDERRLHARQHPHYFAQIDVAGATAGGGALDVQLLHRALQNQRNTGLLRGDIDKQVFTHKILMPAFCSSWVVSNKGSPMMPE